MVGINGLEKTEDSDNSPITRTKNKEKIIGIGLFLLQFL
jgi:hypothetical protein